MKLNAREYGRMLSDHHIHIVYNGPIWAKGIDGIAEMMLKRLELDDMPYSASQGAFSVFVEQINNMMMYSAEKDQRSDADGNLWEVPKGIFILGVRDNAYFVCTGNVLTDKNAATLEQRIDYLNTLDKKELRKYYKQQLHAENDNEESKGAGVGLIEIARRASEPIVYELEPLGDGLQYFTMYITISQVQGGKI